MDLEFTSHTETSCGLFFQTRRNQNDNIKFNRNKVVKQCLMSCIIPQAGLHLSRHSVGMVRKQELSLFRGPVRHEEQKSTTCEEESLIIISQLLVNARNKNYRSCNVFTDIPP